MTDTGASNTSVASPGSVGTALLSCLIGGRAFAIPITRVREILGMIAVTALPHAERHVLGVGHHRGRLLPVIDLRRKLGLAEAGGAAECCIVVVEAGLEAGPLGGAFCVGCVVDEAVEVVTPPAAGGESIVQAGDPEAAGAGSAVHELVVLDIEQLLADLVPAPSDRGA